jgi:LAS superfamily LD-carboxypeptidase LdcB
MSFLERFKAQPKHKSTDPEVRLAAVHELGTDPDDGAVLVALAREDGDARVRRAAAARVDNVAVLASIALSDADEGLRAETAERLTAMASADRQDVARQALGALRDQKYIATVAKTSPLEAIRAEAIGRLSDPKASARWRGTRRIRGPRRWRPSESRIVRSS